MLFNSLCCHINSYKPEFILIHSGGKFLKHISTFVKLLPKLKKLYPHINLGIQRRKRLVRKNNEIIPLLDNGKQIEKIENLIFKVNR